jgi:E3 ubiquitin-protein ligase ZNF598
MENVICTEDHNARFQTFTIWGENAGPDFSYDHKSRVFFPKKYYKSKVEALWSAKCKECNSWKRDITALKKHVTADHDCLMCALCIEHKKVFPSEQIIYSKAAYENHLRRGEGEGFEGHPQCEFCRKRYYDKDMLFGHLHKDHFSCHICERAGIRYRYYKDYSSLESHFRSEHILCEDPECLARKFIVFADSIDHAAHMLAFHPNSQVSIVISSVMFCYLMFVMYC